MLITKKLDMWIDLDPQIVRPEAALSVVTSTTPKICSKAFSYIKNFDGGRTLHKSTSANITSGTVERRIVRGLGEFAELLVGLNTSQALVYGVAPRASMRLMTNTAWHAAGCPDDAVARTRKGFSWNARQPSVLMLDVDAPSDGSDPLDRDALVAAIRAACPGLADARMLHWPSSSSFIVDAESGEEISGLRGQRLYLLVLDAADIERAGAALAARLWHAGHGRIEVSKSGALLERTLVDTSVWQPERIDFASGAHCAAPLEQRRGDPVLIDGGAEWIDTRIALPDLTTAERAQVDARKRAAKAAVRGESEAAKDAWIEDRVRDSLTRNPSVEPDVARAQARRAIEGGVLGGDFVLNVEGEQVTVLEVLDHPERYHRKRTLDPIEPGYDGGREVGMLLLHDGRPRLRSFAHGGATYRLERQPERVLIAKGRADETVDEVVAKLNRADSDIFGRGGNVVTVNDGALMRMSDWGLIRTLGQRVQFYSLKKDGVGLIEVEQDPPMPIAKMILASTHELRPLRSILTAPTLRPDGSVLTAIGYDVATGYLLAQDGDTEFVPVPERPTREQAIAALTRLWTPFSEFAFVGPLDRAAHLAALLTACVRGSLPTAPGFGYDAPNVGSGKTLLASCVAVLATGKHASVSPAPQNKDHDDAEMRKSIFAALRDGRRAIVYDNVLGIFNSPSLAAALTQPTYTDRVLQESRQDSVPTDAVWCVTGNNLTLGKDLTRRFVVCRVDRKTEGPDGRAYDIAPGAYCLTHRQAMVSAGLTLIRFYLASGVGAIGAGVVPSFEQWDAWIRQAILYVSRAIADGYFGDVWTLLSEATISDPEQESTGALLQALHACFGDDRVEAKKIAGAAMRGHKPQYGIAPPDEKALADAFLDCGLRELTPNGVAKALGFRKDRIVGGLKLVKVKGAGGAAASWRVVSDHPSEGRFDVRALRAV